MKNLRTYLLAILLVGLWACEKEEDPANQDLEAPVFQEITRPRTEGGSGVVKLRGEYAEVRGENSTHWHIRGTVTDNVGLSELKVDVHGVHDGHSHGRTNFLPEYSFEYVVNLNGETEFTFDDPDFEGRILYYDGSSTAIEGTNFRAGPYDVILHAVDQAGNTTSFAEGSSILRQIYLRRPYQPLIAITADPNESVDELEFEPGEQLEIDGWIQQNRGAGDLAFPVSFIRINIVEDDHDHSHRKLDEVRYEATWGASHYLTNSAGGPLTGRTLPAFQNNMLMFNTLLAEVPYTLSEGDDHMTLRIEVEDEGGNLAIREFELEVHD